MVLKEEHDTRLLQLLREDRVPVADLLHWLHAHHGPGPPPVAQAQVLPPDDSMLHQQWREQLGMTTPQSFAVTFLNYVRAEVQPIIAIADSIGEVVVKSSFQPADTIQSKEPETTFGLNATSEAPKIVTENASTFNASKGGKDRRKSTGTILQAIQEPKHLQLPVYDDDFPALGNAPNSNVKKNVPQSKQKRRVNPTPMVNPVVDSAFILAKVEAPLTTQQNHGNKSKLPGTGPVKVDMDILMQRCEISRKQKQKEKPEAPKKENIKHWSWEKFDSRLSSTSSQGLPSNVEAAGPQTEVKFSGGFGDVHAKGSAFPPTTQIVPKCASMKSVSAGPAIPTVSEKERAFSQSRSSVTESLPLHCLSNTLTNLASVHASLMDVKLVPSLLEELHFLLQLLSLEPASSGASPGGSKGALSLIAENKQEKEPLFANGDDCAGYATLVMEQAGRILDCVGEQILVALIEEPAIARHSATLLVRLKASLADQQAAALRSFKAYETASRTNGVIEQSPMAGTVRLTPGLPVSLPFQASRDSRNIFKTQEEQRAYNNREQCRDQFYAIIREAASAFSAFGWISTGAEGEGYLKMKDSVRNFLQVLLVENYPWFAELFLEQVLQASNCGETDPEVTSLARQDPAKLQRLHDRLTSTNTSRLPAAPQKQGGSGMGNGDSRLMLSPGSPWSKVKSTEQRLLLKKNGTSNDIFTNNVQVLNKGRNSIGNGRERSTLNTDVGSKFSSYFPQFLCVYVWFLEAADSHRLNTQMMWSIKGKINILTQLPPYSRDAADIGSGFTQRVLALKALAGLLGYLFVSPGAGARPPIPGPGAHDSGGSTLWDVARSEPPVDVPAVLAKAQMEGSVLLNLPWILEFLRLLKADWLAVSHPQFQSIILSLRDMYLLPMLNPSSEQFGVGSICILASLDAFFEYMDLIPFNGEWCNKANISPVKHKDAACTEGKDIRRLSEIQAEERPLAFKGLDTMLGIIDSRYIQHCSPLLMELRGVLVEGKKRRHRQREPNWPDSPGQPRARTVRKITPVQRTGPSQPLDISNNLPTGEKVAAEHGSDSQDDQLKLKLQRTFLEQRPHLRRVVDFVVDTAASNAARAAVLKLVPSAFQNAQEKLQMVLRGNGGDTSPATSSPWSISKGSQVETAVEHIITTTIHQLLGPALDYAKGHAADRTAEALAALADPEESSFVLSVAAGIAAETAGQAACQKALASISGEIRKRITDDVETWRRRSLLYGLETHGGSPTNPSRRMRAQSWPRAAMQQLPAECPDQLEIGIVQEVSGLSDIVTAGSVPIPDYRASREPDDEGSPSKSSRSVACSHHAITDTCVQLNGIPTNSSMTTAKTSMAVKRQLSFSFQELINARKTSDFKSNSHLVEDQSENLANGSSHLRELRVEETRSRRWSIESSLGENGQTGPDQSSTLRETGPGEAQVRRWSVGSTFGGNGQKRPHKVYSLLDRMEEHDSANGFASGAVVGELTGPQIFAARIAEACSNACFYCSVKPFKGESRHFLRQHLAIICISLEGLLSRISGAIPAGGFDALVFNQDTHMQWARLCEEAPSNPGTSSTSRNCKLQLQVERGLVRRSVALAVHLLLWDPTLVLDSSSSDMLGHGLGESNFLQKRDSEMASGLPPFSNGLNSSATKSREETARLNSFGLTTSQERESAGYYSEAAWTVMYALTVTWRNLIEAAILSKEFILQELLTAWRWKLAMTSQPWQGFVDGFFEDWSVTVQKGIASVLIGLIGLEMEALSEGYEIQLCDFVRAMSEKNIFCENGSTSTSKDTSSTIGMNSTSNLSISSVRTKQDRLVNRTESLAAGLAVLILQHYSPELCIDKFRVQNGQLVRSSKDAEGSFIPLRKLVENLFLGEKMS